MDAPLYDWNKNTVKTVNCIEGIGSREANSVFSAEKVMATIFWESHGVIIIDSLQKGKYITGEYYASLIDKLKVEIADKRPHLQK